MRSGRQRARARGGCGPEPGEGPEVEGGGEQGPLGLDVGEAAEEEAAGGPSEVELLTEIRDELRKR